MTHPRVKHHSRDFGYGFDKQPEDGGFDEVAARNHLLSLLKETPHNYAILLDSDEIVSNSTIRCIDTMEREQATAANIECWHFCSPNEYMFFPYALWKHGEGRPAMHDPHIRIVRHDSGLVYKEHRDTALQATWPNRTMHCEPHIADPTRLVLVPGMFHIHTHHMFEPKRTRYNATHQKDWETRSVATSPLDEHIIDAYRLQEESRSR